MSGVSGVLPSSLFATLALVLLTVGLMLAGRYASYLASRNAAARSLAAEFALAAVAAVPLGFGVFFLVQNMGVFL